MQKLNHKLSGILLISILASLAFPVYIIGFIEPSFSHFVTLETEKDASMVANHMARLFFPIAKELEKENISNSKKIELAQMIQEFDIIKVKIYSPKGKIIFSTDPKNIGEINTHKYFYNLVAKGQTLSKVVQKNQTTMEGATTSVNVVETYIPIFRHGSFAGAFEIYNDITKETQSLTNLSHKFRTVSILISGLLLLAIIFTTNQAKTSRRSQKIAEKNLQDERDNLERRVISRTKDLSELNDTLEQEITERQKAEQENKELIDQLTKALNEVKTLSGLLPICSSCKHIKNKEGKWQKIEHYVQNETDAQFTHGICPKCAKILYPDIYDDIPPEDLHY